MVGNPAYTSGLLLGAVIAALYSFPVSAKPDVVASTPTSAENKNQPTLEETEHWLTEKVNEFGSYDFHSYLDINDRSRQAYSLTFVGCVLNVENQENIYREGGKTYLGEPTHKTVSLADLSPVTISIGPSHSATAKYADATDVYAIKLQTTDKKKKVKISTPDDSVIGYRDNLDIEVTDAVMARRIEKAMRYAISICRGQSGEMPAKDEPF